MRDIARPTISARYLLAALPDRRATTVVPEGLVITKCAPRVAYGSRKSRSSGGGGAQPTTTVVAQADRRAVLAYAARATINKR